jgi:hypothetical protein
MEAIFRVAPVEVKPALFAMLVSIALVSEDTGCWSLANSAQTFLAFHFVVFEYGARALGFSFHDYG